MKIKDYLIKLKNIFLTNVEDSHSLHKIYCYDENIFKHSLAEVLSELSSKLESLEDRIERLESENVGTTNELYRLENSLDARIDILAEEFYNSK